MKCACIDDLHTPHQITWSARYSANNRWAARAPSSDNPFCCDVSFKNARLWRRSSGRGAARDSSNMMASPPLPTQMRPPVPPAAAAWCSMTASASTAARQLRLRPTTTVRCRSRMLRQPALRLYGQAVGQAVAASLPTTSCAARSSSLSMFVDRWTGFDVATVGCRFCPLRCCCCRGADAPVADSTRARSTSRRVSLSSDRTLHEQANCRCVARVTAEPC